MGTADYADGADQALEIPDDDSMAGAYGLEVKDEIDPCQTWETACGYERLEMFDEAEALFRSIPPEIHGWHAAAQARLCRLYHGQHRNEDIVRIGRRLIAEN